jgi:hypothetical protein
MTVLFERPGNGNVTSAPSRLTLHVGGARRREEGPNVGGGRRSAALGFAQDRIQAIDIGLNLFAASLVHDLPPHHSPGVCEPVSGRLEITLDVVDPFTDHDLYVFGSLAENHDLERLLTFGHAHRDLLGDHLENNLPRTTVLRRRPMNQGLRSMPAHGDAGTDGALQTSLKVTLS